MSPFERRLAEQSPLQAASLWISGGVEAIRDLADETVWDAFVDLATEWVAREQRLRLEREELRRRRWPD